MASSRIFIKGLPPALTEAECRKHFSAQNREVTDVKVIGQRRIGYVGFKSAEDAAAAVKYFNKTYIRMSKISVEVARPISDPVLGKGQRNKFAGPVSENERQQSFHSTDDANSKKRKREEPGQKADPKLQEYLQVMRTARESLVADETTPNPDATLVPNGASVVPEAESDDEYEEVPQRQEKQRKTDRHMTEPSQAAATPSAREKSAPVTMGQVADTTPGVMQVSDPEPATQPLAGVEEQAETVAKDTTDDDWLRSRTNRLLDLVDPEDLPQAPGPAAASAPVDRSDNQAVGNDEALPHSQQESPAKDERGEGASFTATEAETAVDAISRTARLFVRNLPYSATEDDLQDCFGKFGHVEEVHLPIKAGGSAKGFALVLFTKSEDAVTAFQTMDGTTFQGRLLHIIPADEKRDQGIDDFGMSNLPLKKQNLIRKKKEAAATTFNWNSLYMSQDAVNSSVASRLGVSKSELLDPTSADAGVKQAIAETSVIQETKAFFAANGVDLEAFKSHKRGDTAILVKNFPYGTTMDELRKMFEESGTVLKVLMPPTGTIAIVQFAQPNHAKSAFGKLAYRRIKDSVLFLEKAPKDLFVNEETALASQISDNKVGSHKVTVTDLLSSGDKADEDVETTSLFIRNLNFATTTSKLAETFKTLDGFVSARVKTKTDPKKPGQTLSMGFGFAEFRSKTQAQAALKVMNGFVLDSHTLTVKASHKGHDAAEERRREDNAKKAAAKRTKIVVKNLPFQATKKDVRALLGTYGELRSVRVPKKADYTSRGFAFADFVTPREAENALNALKDTHLLGRRLVLDFAEAEALDAEEEIEKMQRKVGGQVNKVALQQLTGGGRKRVNIGNEDEDGMEG